MNNFKKKGFILQFKCSFFCLIFGIIFQTSQCGISFGCFRSPEGCNGDACAIIITYVLAPNMSDYLDVRMLTSLNWVALGHKPENSTFGMVCKSTLLIKNFTKSCKANSVRLIWIYYRPTLQGFPKSLEYLYFGRLVKIIF